MAAKYLDENGLLYFWVKVKSKINEKASMSEVEAKGYQTSSQVNTLITNKGYTTMSAVESKGYQTSSQVASAIQDALKNVVGIKYEKVNSLPSTGKDGVIYLVPKEGATQDSYAEYIWFNNAFEYIGDSNSIKIDPIQNTDIDTILAK